MTVLSSAWSATKWTASLPLKKNTYVIGGIALGAAAVVALAAPPVAFAAAAQGITAGSGIGAYASAGAGLSVAGTKAVGAGLAQAYTLMPWDQVGAAMAGAVPTVS